mgnify:CR=1 FL=1
MVVDGESWYVVFAHDSGVYRFDFPNWRATCTSPQLRAGMTLTATTIPVKAGEPETRTLTLRSVTFVRRSGLWSAIVAFDGAAGITSKKSFQIDNPLDNLVSKGSRARRASRKWATCSRRARASPARAAARRAMRPTRVIGLTTLP